MIEIKPRRKYLVGTVKKQRSRSEGSGKNRGKDSRKRVYTYDPSKHVLVISATGKRRWVHEQ